MARDSKGKAPASAGAVHIENVRLNKLKPADYNPRTISDAALKGLRASIHRYGLVEPIVWNKRSGNIVAGHQRLKVLLEDGVKETQVVVLDLPEAEEKALNLALNNPAIAGDFTDAVRDILDELHASIPEVCIDLMLDAVAVDVAGTLDQIKSEWQDMPDFVSEDLEGRRIVVHFQDEGAVRTFAELIQQPITDKTRAINFPPIEKTNERSFYYTDEVR